MNTKKFRSSSLLLLFLLLLLLFIFFFKKKMLRIVISFVSLVVSASMSITTVALFYSRRQYEPTFVVNGLHYVAVSSAFTMSRFATKKRDHLTVLVCGLLSFCSSVVCWWSASQFLGNDFLYDHAPKTLKSLYEGTVPYTDGEIDLKSYAGSIDGRTYAFRFAGTVTVAILETCSALLSFWEATTKRFVSNTVANCCPRIHFKTDKCMLPIYCLGILMTHSELLIIFVCTFVLRTPRWSVVDSPHVLTFFGIVSASSPPRRSSMRDEMDWFWYFSLVCLISGSIVSCLATAAEMTVVRETCTIAPTKCFLNFDFYRVATDLGKHQYVYYGEKSVENKFMFAVGTSITHWIDLLICVSGWLLSLARTGQTLETLQYFSIHKYDLILSNNNNNNNG